MTTNWPESLRIIAKDHLDTLMPRFRRKSVVMRYIQGDVDGKLDQALLDYLQGCCASSMRLFQTAITAYENLAVGPPLTKVNTIPALLLVTCGHSALDSLAAAMCAALTGAVPLRPRDIPGLSNVKVHLRNHYGREHAIAPAIDALRAAPWYAELTEARHKMLHRGFWPMPLGNTGFRLCEIRPMGKEGQSTMLKDDPVDLTLIAVGLLCELEKWEDSIQGIMDAEQVFEPVSDFIIHNFDTDPEWLGTGMNWGFNFTPRRPPS
jgi:hypothetical protein